MPTSSDHALTPALCCAKALVVVEYVRGEGHESGREELRKALHNNLSAAYLMAGIHEQAREHANKVHNPA